MNLQALISVYLLEISMWEIGNKCTKIVVYESKFIIIKQYWIFLNFSFHGRNKIIFISFIKVYWLIHRAKK